MTTERALQIAIDMLENIAKGGTYPAKDFHYQLVVLNEVLGPQRTLWRAAALIAQMADATHEVWDSGGHEPTFHGGSIAYSDDDSMTLSQIIVDINKGLSACSQGGRK